MILYVKGDIFQSPAQVLVNAVNTVGVMGKGIALEFKRLFPEMYGQYRQLCESGKIQIGTLWLYKTPNKNILNFPTKKHWREPSRVEYIELGLRKFVETYSKMGIHSIAFPPIGCGNGQLDFRTQVQPLMERYLRNLPIEVFIYPERSSSFVEHLNQSEMERWLRSEPESMPFSEVWNDLCRILSAKRDFETVRHGSPFTAKVLENPPAIEITKAHQTYMLDYDTMLAFWQQLRTHGFTMRHIAPGVDRTLSYIIPIFAELDYVTPVNVADKYDNMRIGNSVIGLQILPSAFSRPDSASTNTAGQLPLL